MIFIYQHLPQYIDPIVFSIGSFAVRWYAVSYIVGFGVIYFILMWRMRNEEAKNISQISNFQFTIFKQFSISELKNSKNDLKIQNTEYQIRNTLVDFLLVIFFAALVGGRIGYVLFYNAAYFWAHPLSIISPYEGGQLIGIYGMSYHGALVGAIFAGWIFTRIKKINFWSWADFIIIAVPAGYFFGRVGNFLNGELYGRVTTSPLGMYFSADPGHLRYPSQLLEAFLEGILLFLILWKIRKWKFVRQLAQGSLLAIYLVGYGVARIFGEQFREPDSQIGFLFGFFTMGQILSLGMIFAGLVFLILKNRKMWYTGFTTRNDF